jgi:hypothetical protein
MGWIPEVTSIDLGGSSVSIPSPAPRIGVEVRITNQGKQNMNYLLQRNARKCQNCFDSCSELVTLKRMKKIHSKKSNFKNNHVSIKDE